ncbi:hypothetical protein [Mixta sp. Marseille-Q2659]|uniref:hypothetical protein n=1 Tax=Mixta sp. Marseille-Q2659 TaxID=2736607 RepID=UPI0023B8A4C3|nr:hypothetical protein [Mixta sp. Marseille-Q2659]
MPPAAVQALPQGDNSVTVSGADVAGNPAQANYPFTVDTAGPILFDVEAGVGADGILNQLEALAGINIVGLSAPGQQVTVTLNGRTYNGIADGDGGLRTDPQRGSAAAKRWHGNHCGLGHRCERQRQQRQRGDHSCAQHLASADVERAVRRRRH